MANLKNIIIGTGLTTLLTIGFTKFFTAAKNFKNNFVLNVTSYRVHKLNGTTIETIADLSMLNANNIGTTIRNLFVKVQYEENKAWFDLATSPVIIPSLTITPNRQIDTSIKLNYSLMAFPFGLLKPMVLGAKTNIKIISKFEVGGITQTIENIVPLQVPSAFINLVKLVFPNLKGLGNTQAIASIPQQVSDNTPPVLVAQLLA